MSMPPKEAMEKLAKLMGVPVPGASPENLPAPVGGTTAPTRFHEFTRQRHVREIAQILPNKDILMWLRLHGAAHLVPKDKTAKSNFMRSLAVRLGQVSEPAFQLLVRQIKEYREGVPATRARRIEEASVGRNAWQELRNALQSECAAYGIEFRGKGGKRPHGVRRMGRAPRKVLGPEAQAMVAAGQRVSENISPREAGFWLEGFGILHQITIAGWPAFTKATAFTLNAEAGPTARKLFRMQANAFEWKDTPRAYEYAQQNPALFSTLVDRVTQLFTSLIGKPPRWDMVPPGGKPLPFKPLPGVPRPAAKPASPPPGPEQPLTEITERPEPAFERARGRQPLTVGEREDITKELQRVLEEYVHVPAPVAPLVELITEKYGTMVRRFKGGAFAKPFLSDRGRVVKITKDPTEAHAALRLIGKQHPNVATIYQVNLLPSLTKTKWYIIEVERVVPLSEVDPVLAEWLFWYYMAYAQGRGQTGRYHGLGMDSYHRIVDFDGPQPAIRLSGSALNAEARKFLGKLAFLAENGLDPVKGRRLYTNTEIESDPSKESRIRFLGHYAEMIERLIRDRLWIFDLHGMNIGFRKLDVDKRRPVVVFDLGLSSLEHVKAKRKKPAKLKNPDDWEPELTGSPASLLKEW
jgi:hypothetical protein